VKCKSIYALLFLIFQITRSETSTAQPPVSVSVQLDSAGYRIGDYIGLTVSISHPYELQMGWVGIGMRLGNQFDVIRQVANDSIRQENFLTEQKKYLITTFDTGWLSIPPMVVFYKSPSGKWDSSLSDPLPVYIGTIHVDAAKGPKPIKPLLMAESDSKWKWLAGAAFILLAAGSFYYWYRIQKKKNKDRKKKVVPRKSPYERTKEKLKELDDEQLWQKGNLNEYYLRLTYILREYVEETLQIPALEITTIEMLRALQKKLTETSLLDQLKRDLLLTDLVKYAKLKPGDEDHQRVMATIIEFIEKTKPELITEKNKALA